MSARGGKRRVRFQVRAEPGSKVAVAGSFNSWDATSRPLVEKDGDGVFKALLMLSPGRYEYKFVINGVWCVDPECAEWVTNDYGSLNSVLTVG